MSAEIALLAGKTADLQTVKSVGVCVCLCAAGEEAIICCFPKSSRWI